VLEQIVARTDGVPLFVEELTKSVLESGLLHEEGDRYTLHRPLPALVIRRRCATRSVSRAWTGSAP
jgi:predicted ATPase